MSRFFTIFNPDRLESNSAENYLDKALDFYSSNINETLHTKFFEALDGRLKGFVLYRKDERNRFHHDQNNGTIVISDGSPLIGNQSINAEKINHLYNSKGISSFAVEMDGGHIELIIDEKDKSINLIRDRIGLKPAYFSNKCGFVCSSNAGAIIRSGLIESKPNEKIIGKYAVCNFRANYGSKSTFFKNIYLIPPSTIISFKNNELYKKKYWDWNPQSSYIKKSGDELSQIYRSKIESAVKNYHSACDTDKLAVALSGGVDSGTIIGMIHSITNQKIDAISLSYDEKTDYDESYLIQCSVRDHVDNWTDLKLDPYILLDDLQGLYDKFDIPLATVSIYGYDYLYREMALRGYKDIFTGAGGDYFQSGNYPCFFYYFADLKYSNSSLFNKEVNSWMENHGTDLYPKTQKTVYDFFEKNIDFSQPGKLKTQELFLQSENILDKDYYNKIENVNSNLVDSYGTYQRTYIVQEFLYEAVPPGAEAEDLIDWLYGTSMTSPFFAKDLIDLGWELSPDQKIKNGTNKVLSRKALRGICAKEILDRIQKSGFNAPFDIWVRGPLNEFVMDIFSSKSFLNRGIYNVKKFNQALNQHISGTHDHMMLLWQALNLELWMKKWIK